MLFPHFQIEDGSNPGGGGGQGDLPPVIDGQGDKPPDPTAGKGTSFTEEQYKSLQAEYTKNRQNHKTLIESAQKWGYGDTNGNVSEDELQQHFQELVEMSVGNVESFIERSKAQKPGTEKPGEPAKPVIEQPKVDPTVIASLRMSFNANKGVHKMTFLQTQEKAGNPIDEETIKELDLILNKMIRETPKLFDTEDNWYERVMKYGIASNPKLRAKYEQSVIKREDERRAKVNNAGGGLGGGASATGKSSTVEEELKKRFSG